MVLLTFSACQGLVIDKAISRYHEVAGNISLGDSKEKVLSFLQPMEEKIPPEYRKNPEAFFVADSQGKEHSIEIYYFHSVRYPDYLITDDEFTPYVFRDGTLIAVGWAYLGGPKTVHGVQPDQREPHKNRQRTICKPDYMGGFSCSTTMN
ncbi:MAG: hypothetical protein AB7R40_05745 [Nitrospiraceae bacterium]